MSDPAKQKILFLNHYTHIDAVLNKLSETFSVTCFSGYRNNSVRNTFKIVPVKSTAFGINIFLNQLLKLEVSVPTYIHNFETEVQKEKPDFIIAYDLYHFSFIQAVRYKKRHPTVKVYLYSETKIFPKNKLTRLVFSFFWRYFLKNVYLLEKIFVFTDQGKDFFKKAVPVCPVAVLPIPVDVNLFKPAEKKTWLPNNTLRILMNARYVSYKRHADLIKAAKLLKSHGYRFHITFIGREGVMQREIETMVDEADLTNSVTFLSPVPLEMLLKIYHNHDVLVLPSYNEAIGTVVPEAMACGIPTITSDTVGANVYTKAGETGFVFKTGDVHGLFLFLESCYSQSMLSTLGESASKRVTTEYNSEYIAKKFEQSLVLNS